MLQASRGARWLVVGAALVSLATGFARLGLPSPYLLASFVVGIAYALLSRTPLTIPRRAAVGGQGVIGVTAGSYLVRSTVTALGAHLAPILAVSALTVALSVVAGLVLARLSPVDRVTAAFGMIAGGAAGIISLSRELGADERMVAVMQYVRVLLIVAVTPAIAIGVFGMSRATGGPGNEQIWSSHGALYVAGALGAGLWLARALRLPGGSILGPMLLSAAVSLVHRPLVGPVPVVVADAAFALIGLDVGLRFTARALREAGELLPLSVAVIVAMMSVSAALGAGLAAAAHVSVLDGYLATTPGGLTAVIALTVGSNTNATFIVSVQVIRTFLMLAAAPAVARRLAMGWDASSRLGVISARLDPSWTVLASPSTPAVDRCVDIFSRPDGTFGFEAFRRDPEDMGAWTPIAYYSGRRFPTEDDAVAAARDAVPWLADVLDGSS